LWLLSIGIAFLLVFGLINVQQYTTNKEELLMTKDTRLNKTIKQPDIGKSISFGSTGDPKENGQGNSTGGHRNTSGNSNTRNTSSGNSKNNK
jgi:hypothetical protein